MNIVSRCREKFCLVSSMPNKHKDGSRSSHFPAAYIPIAPFSDQGESPLQRERRIDQEQAARIPIVSRPPPHRKAERYHWPRQQGPRVYEDPEMSTKPWNQETRKPWLHETRRPWPQDKRESLNGKNPHQQPWPQEPRSPWPGEKMASTGSTWPRDARDSRKRDSQPSQKPWPPASSSFQHREKRPAEHPKPKDQVDWRDKRKASNAGFVPNLFNYVEDKLQHFYNVRNQKRLSWMTLPKRCRI